MQIKHGISLNIKAIAYSVAYSITTGSDYTFITDDVIYNTPLYEPLTSWEVYALA